MYTLIIDVVPTTDTFTPHLLCIWTEKPTADDVMEKILEWGGPLVYAVDSKQMPLLSEKQRPAEWMGKTLQAADKNWHYTVFEGPLGRTMHIVITCPISKRYVSFGQVQPLTDCTILTREPQTPVGGSDLDGDYH